MGRASYCRRHDQFHLHRVLTISHRHLRPAAHPLVSITAGRVRVVRADRRDAADAAPWNGHARRAPGDTAHGGRGAVRSLGHPHGGRLAGTLLPRAASALFQRDRRAAAAHVPRLRVDRGWRGVLAAATRAIAKRVFARSAAAGHRRHPPATGHSALGAFGFAEYTALLPGMEWHHYSTRPALAGGADRHSGHTRVRRHRRVHGSDLWRYLAL